jgi:hypothetical protein
METLCIENGEIFKNISKIVKKKMCPCGCTMAMGKVSSEGRQLLGRKWGWGGCHKAIFARF